MRFVKIFILILFFVAALASRACSFDAQWLEKYNDGREKILALASEIEQKFGEENLFLTAGSVRKLLASDVAGFDRQLAEDYLDVLETGSGYVAGYEISHVSEDADIKNLRELLAKEPPYNVEFHDDALFKIKKITDYVSLIVSYFPEYIEGMRKIVSDPKHKDVGVYLRDSAFLMFSKNFIAKIDELVPLIAQAEEKFARAQYSFSKSDLDKINDTAQARIESLKNHLGSVHPSVNYARQTEVNYLDDVQKIAISRYEMQNEIMQKNELWEFAEYLKILKSEIGIEEGYTRELLGKLSADANDTKEQEAAKSLTRLLSDFFPKLEFLVHLAQDEVHTRTNWLAMLYRAWQVSNDAVFSLLGSEIWHGEGYRITLRKLMVVAFYLLAGVILSKWLSAIAARTFFSRLTKDAETLVRKTLFYFMLLIAVLVVFHIAEVPLTSFAFFGGALAIGIGFGTQNLFNNIISGFMLATARQFKAGDQIIFNGERYVVVNVGERSTHLWTFEDRDVFVQNKMFLENTVTNMTYRDNSRTKVGVDVGVEYGTDHRKVEACLLDIADRHEKILKSPEPYIRIENFGTSSIDFSVNFWVDLRHASDKKVASEIRGMILDDFAKNGIQIPYPKLDVKVLS